jgi:uncharacterized protein
MMRNGLAVVLSTLLGLILLAGSGVAQEPKFPPLTGPLVDAAALLPPAAREEFDRSLRAYQQSSGYQLVVAIVPSLEGYDIRDYGNRLFRHWKLGDAKRDDGVLLLVAPKERKVSIETGYGVEGVMTDALSRIIIENAITPRFKNGDFAGGIRAGIADIQKVLAGEGRKLETQLAPQRDPFEFWFTIFFWFIILLIFIQIMRGRTALVPGRRLRRGYGGGWVGGWPGGSGGWSGGGGFGGGGGYSGGGGSSGGGGASGSW